MTGRHREPVGEIRVTRHERHPLAGDDGSGTREHVRIRDDEYSIFLPAEVFDAIELAPGTLFRVHKANSYDREVTGG